MTYADVWGAPGGRKETPKLGPMKDILPGAAVVTERCLQDRLVLWECSVLAQRLRNDPWKMPCEPGHPSLRVSLGVPRADLLPVGGVSRLFGAFG